MTLNKKDGTVSLHTVKEDAMAGQVKKKMGRPANGATTLMTISIRPEVKERLFRMARKDRRSASSFTALILERWMDEHPEEDSVNG